MWGDEGRMGWSRWEWGGGGRCDDKYGRMGVTFWV